MGWQHCEDPLGHHPEDEMDTVPEAFSAAKDYPAASSIDWGVTEPSSSSYEEDEHSHSFPTPAAENPVTEVVMASNHALQQQQKMKPQLENIQEEKLVRITEEVKTVEIVSNSEEGQDIALPSVEVVVATDLESQVVGSTGEVVAEQQVVVVRSEDALEIDASGETEQKVEIGAENEAKPVEPKVPWYKSSWFKKFMIRMVIRIIVLGILVALQKFIRWEVLVDDYLGFVDSQPVVLAIFVFFVAATLFSTLSPTGYLPTVLIGASLGMAGAPISYLSVNVAAILNMLMMRRGCKGCANWVVRKRIGEVESVNKMLKHHPIRTVLLLRLPYLGCGVLNYLFSLSQVDYKSSIIGNAIGLLPGSVLFTALGGTARSIFKMITGGSFDAKALVIVIVQIILVISSIVGVAYISRRSARKEAELLAQPEQQQEAVLDAAEADY